MAHAALARNFRPQTFEEVVGQDHITRTLVNAIDKDRVAQAYIFAGPRGCGKTTLARILAKALNCVKGPTKKPCNKCDHCISIARGDDVDVREIDGASHNSVDDIRELRDNVARAPLRTRFKIYYIDEVHMLSPSAFNALLKTLEEPPAHVKFIFATTEPHRIPPAVMSRCQVHYVKLIVADDIVKRLERISKVEKLKIKKEALYAVARAARGGMRDAETLLEMLAGLQSGRKAITPEDVARITGGVSDSAISAIIDAAQAGNAGDALAAVGELIDEGVDPRHLLDSLAEYLRVLMLAATGRTEASALAAWKHHVKTLLQQAEKWSIEAILAAQRIIAEISNTTLRSAPLPALPVETAVVTMSRLGQLEDLSKLVKMLEAGEFLRAPAASSAGFNRRPRAAGAASGGYSPKTTGGSGGAAPALSNSPSAGSSRRTAAPAASSSRRRQDDAAASSRRMQAKAGDGGAAAESGGSDPLSKLRAAGRRGALKRVLSGVSKVDVSADTLKLTFPLGEEELAAQVETGGRLADALLKAVVNAFGGKLDIRVEISGNTVAPDSNPAEEDGEPDAPLFNNIKEYAKQNPTVSELVDRFGAKILDVKPLDARDVSNGDDEHSSGDGDFSTPAQETPAGEDGNDG